MWGEEQFEVIKGIEDLSIYALCCFSNIKLLKKQVEHCLPEIVSIASQASAKLFDDDSVLKVFHARYCHRSKSGYRCVCNGWNRRNHSSISGAWGLGKI